VQGFTQDDARLFVTPEQLDNEFLNVVDLILSNKSLRLQNLRHDSVRDPAADETTWGSDEAWNKAESAIRRGSRNFRYGVL